MENLCLAFTFAALYDRITGGKMRQREKKGLFGYIMLLLKAAYFSGERPFTENLITSYKISYPQFAVVAHKVMTCF